MKFQILNKYTSAIPLCFLALSALPAEAQVVYNIGAQEIYDSNVFLEDDKPVDFSVLGGNVDPEATEQIDSNPNDDFITNAFIGVQGALPIPKYVEGSASAQVGALVFADVTEQNRLTLDAAIELSLAEDFRPEFLTLAVGDNLQSGTSSIANAAGTATRTSETNDAYLALGFGQFDIAPQTTASVNYKLNRRDFLGDFLFSENKDIPDSTQFKERGADFFSNGVDGSISNQVSQKLDVGIGAGVEHTNFTKIRSDAITPEDDPDRIDYRSSIFGNYRASEQFIASARAGAAYSRYDNQRAPQIVVLDQGATTVIPDRDYTSLTFLGSLTYLPQAESSLSLSLGQDVLTDVSGERTLARTARFDIGHEFNERIAGSVGALFSEFDNSDNLGDASDRLELNAGLSYAVTEAISLIAGYNYINQNTDGASQQAFSLSAEDYEVHRAFIGINAGFVGIAS